jgi:hypothetical protein
MPTKPPPPNLTDDLRPGLRQRTEWMTCFNAWKGCVSPSEAREWLAGPPEPLVRHLDERTWAVLLTVMETPQTPDDWADALKAEFPMEDQDEEPLTVEENARLDRVAQIASRE